MFYSINPTLNRSAWASVVMLFVSVTAAHSEAFCKTLSGISERPSDYTQTATSAELFSGNDLGAMTATHQGNCDISSSGTYVLTCTWQFPYRSAHATERFDKLRKLSTECLSDPTKFTKDQNVNHPDYYEAYYFDFNQRILSVSIKDKGALQKTLVFLRMK